MEVGVSSMAKEHVGWYLALLVAGLFYVYYRHEQQTQGGTVPPVSAGGPGPDLNLGGILGGVLNFFGGGSPTGKPAGGGGGPGGPGRGGAPLGTRFGSGGVPDICNHLSIQQMRSPYYQQLCQSHFEHYLQSIGTPTKSVHPTPAIAGQTVHPQDLWSAALQAPGQQSSFYAYGERGCKTCPGSYTSTWFDAEEPPHYMRSYPRYESYGNVGEL